MGPALHLMGALIWPVLSHKLTVPSMWPTQHTSALLYSMQLTAACGCSFATLHSDRFTLDSCAERLPWVATHTCTSRLTLSTVHLVLARTAIVSAQGCPPLDRPGAGLC